MSRRHLFAAALLSTALALGTVDAFTLREFTFEDPAQETAFRELTGKLRCLVCQNESLAASQADLAQDLRKEVYAMMKAGKGQDEIIAFLVDRYGDFVLYQPPVKPSTYILWFGPFVLIGLGGWFLLRTLKTKRGKPEQAVSDADHARIQQILAIGEPQDPAK